MPLEKLNLHLLIRLYKYELIGFIVNDKLIIYCNL